MEFWKKHMCIHVNGGKGGLAGGWRRWEQRLGVVTGSCLWSVGGPQMHCLLYGLGFLYTVNTSRVLPLLSVSALVHGAAVPSHGIKVNNENLGAVPFFFGDLLSFLFGPSLC